MRHLSVITLVVLIVGATIPEPAAAQAVSVLVDGRLVPFDQPPAVIAGRLLVPLRGVFERLGARVLWQPGLGRVVAQRGDTQVMLQPGSRQAYVNGQPVVLDSAPLMLGGRVLVPLRFISESLGAGVDWDPGTRTVYVNSSAPAAFPPAPRPAPQPVQPQPLPPFQPVPAPAPVPAPGPEPIRPPQPQTVLEGTVLRVEPHTNPPRLQIRSTDGALTTIAVRPQTSIFVTEATSGRSGAAALDQIRRGDQVQVRLDGQLRAVAIRARYHELTGRIERMSGRQIVLADGQIVRLADDAAISMDGREVNRTDLRVGMETVLRLHPQTGEVWEVRARALAAAPAAPAPAAGVRIDTAAFNATAPLGAGGVLVVKAQGTPGSEAFFDIAGSQSGLRMVEGPPGHFTGQYAVRQGETVNQAAVTVRLRSGGAEVAKSAGTVILDGLAPQFARVQPVHDVVLRVSQPTIAAWFTERGPAGIDMNSARLWVHGAEVRPDRTETYVSYTPPSPLPTGRIQVMARVGDRAGNIATTSWSFVIDPQGASTAPLPAPVAVTPSPRPAPAAGVRIDTAAFNTTAPLGAGGVLVVKAQGTPGSEAFFDIAGSQSVRMVEGPPGHFTGQYAVRPGEAVNQAAVTVRLRAGGAEVSKSAGTVILDGLAPQFNRVQPVHDVVVRVAQPTIAAWFTERGPAGLDANSPRMWVNGTEVRVERTETYMSYTPSTPFPNGRIQVMTRVGDRAGNIATTSWSFVVDLSGASTAPAPPPAAVRTPAPAAVTPTARAAEVASPVITHPAAGEATTSAALIRGTGPAGHRIEVTIEFQFAGNASKVLGPFITAVGSNGTWEVQVQLSPADIQSARQATVSAVAIAPSGARSAPVAIQLRAPTREP